MFKEELKILRLCASQLVFFFLHMPHVVYLVRTNSKDYHFRQNAEITLFDNMQRCPFSTNCKPLSVRQCKGAHFLPVCSRPAPTEPLLSLFSLWTPPLCCPSHVIHTAVLFSLFCLPRERGRVDNAAEASALVQWAPGSSPGKNKQGFGIL